MSISITPVLCGDIQENAYLVRADGGRSLAVIDPGDDYAALTRAIGGAPVGAILLTHGHFDHTMAAGRLAEDTGAPLYAGEADLEMLNEAALNGYTDLMGFSAMPGPAMRAEPYGETLSACGLAFRVLPTPGHSKGSVCLYLPEAGVLFSGDTLFRAGYGRLDLHGGSVQDMIDSLKALFALPPEVRVYPGHGDPTTIGEERARYRL